MARSLRHAFGNDIRLVGVDYGRSSSGLHSHVLDDVVVFPKWDELNLDLWGTQLRQVCRGRNDRLIPSLDPEIRLMTAVGLDDWKGLLAPDKSALEACGKPAVRAANLLGLALPASSSDLTTAGLRTFLQHSPDGVWVRGSTYEAQRALTVSEARRAVEVLTMTWGEVPHLSRHVTGQEWSIAFAAYEGRLCAAVGMFKQQVTAEGKTWSGRVEPLQGSMLTPLRRMVKNLHWTGGGEVEMVRSWQGVDHLIEVNPRFPAWIHGASLVSVNLPAALVAASRGHHNRRHYASAGGFTRVVEEIPLRNEIGLPAFRWNAPGGLPIEAKHPSDLPSLARLGGSPDWSHRQLPQTGKQTDASRRSATTREEARWLGNVLRNMPKEPYNDVHLSRGEPSESVETDPSHRNEYGRHISTRVINERSRELSSAFAHHLPGQWEAAFSVKTCPSPLVLHEVRLCGLLAEVINGEEYALARNCGFRSDQIIVNGPAKYWRQGWPLECHSLFADSVGELEWLLAGPLRRNLIQARNIGLRLAPTGLPSRFGETLSTQDAVERATDALRKICARYGSNWGLHIHFPQSVTGTERWLREAESTLTAARPFAALIGTPPAILDTGGGWDPNALDEWAPTLATLISRVVDDNSTTVLIEPGKLIAEPAGVLTAQVLAVRHRGATKMAVTEASVSDLPQAPRRAHPVARKTPAGWALLDPGEDSILGRSCIEEDVLRNRDVDLTHISQGDVLAFGMCGGYDASMAYSFAEGRLRSP